MPLLQLYNRDAVEGHGDKEVLGPVLLMEVISLDMLMEVKIDLTSLFKKSKSKESLTYLRLHPGSS